MGRRLVPLTLDNLQDLPKRGRACVVWELDPVSGQAAVKAGTPALEKEAWISAVLLEWGSCGRVAYVDDMPVGFVLYAPPAYVPRSMAFPTSPVSPDAVQLMTAFTMPGYQGQGLGRRLLRVLEARARASGCDGLWLNAWQDAPQALAFYRREGFAIVGTTAFVVGEDAKLDWRMAKALA